MDWVWRQLAQYARPGRLVVEFQGVTDEGLQAALRQEALRRLRRVESVVFCDELTDSEKVQALMEQFLDE